MDIRLKQINPKLYYSARKICKMGIFPWTHVPTFNERIQRPGIAKVLKPMIENNKQKKSYKLKGSNIIKFIKKLEEGKIEL